MAFSRIGIDHVGPVPMSLEGNQYIFSIQDQLSKYITLIPVQTVTAAETAGKLMEEYFYYYGPPQEIISDNA